MFLLLGNALGLSVARAVSPTAGGAIRFWSWIYVAATMLFSYFMGAYLCTRSSETPGLASGALHGAVSWGLTTTVAAFFAVLISPAAAAIFRGVGTDSGNWLAICIVGLGFFAAAMGGTFGKEAVRYVREGDEAAIPSRAA